MQVHYETDKVDNKLIEIYENYFQQIKEKQISLFELGIYKGGSLLFWRDYFNKGTIVGLDINNITMEDLSGRIKTFKGLQQDFKLLDKIRFETAPDGFDIIIDDASHIGELTKLSFWHLFDNHLASGGYYIIEDWRTGYYAKWPDGKKFSFKKESLRAKFLNEMDNYIDNRQKKESSRNQILFRKGLVRLRNYLSTKKFNNHEYGMVGFAKQLVDEMGMDVITGSRGGNKVPQRNSKIKYLHFHQGIIVIKKT